MVDYREDAKWTVYVHISPLNKYYVGITSNKPNERWRNGKGYDYNTHFYRAINHYGWNNFQHEIIAENLTKHEACEFEKTLIKELRSNDYHYGYNVSDGGEYGRFGIRLSNETKEKIRKANLNKYVSEETKRKISKNHANVKYDKNPNAKSTYQFNSNGEFVAMYNSVSQAYKITGIDKHSISVACANNRMAGGYLWAHDNNVIVNQNSYKLKINSYIDKRTIIFNKEVFQFTTNGIFVARYNSCEEASKITGISRPTISSNAKNKSKSTKYLWRYRDDVIESTDNVGSFLLK